MGAQTAAGAIAPEPPAGRRARIREGLDDVMPLLFVGIAAFILAYLSFRGNLTPLPGHYPIWILFSLVGVIATGGSLLAAALPDTGPIGDVVTIPRAEWEELVARQLPQPAPARRAPPPESPVAPGAVTVPPGAASEPNIDGLLEELERIATEVGGTPPPSAPPPPAPPPVAASVPAPAPASTVAALPPIRLPLPARPDFLEEAPVPTPTYCRGCGKRRPPSELVGRCADCGEPICRTCVATGRRRDGVPICSACADLQDAVDGKLPREFDE